MEGWARVAAPVRTFGVPSLEGENKAKSKLLRALGHETGQSLHTTFGWKSLLVFSICFIPSYKRNICLQIKKTVWFKPNSKNQL